MKLSKVLVALGLSLVSIGAFAVAPPPPPPPPGTAFGTCSVNDVLIGSAAATACRGYFTGNLNNADDFRDGVKSYLEGQFGVTLGSSIIEQIVTDRYADFTTVLGGDVVVGVHWGGGAGGGNTSFYFFDNLPADGIVDPVDVNPYLLKGGLSNVALYSTDVPVPVPATLALLGLGALGLGFSRRRKQA